MALNFQCHVNTSNGKFSHLVLTADSNNYFGAGTTVTLADSQAGAPAFTVKKLVPFSNNRKLLIRFTAVRPVKGGAGAPGTTPVESGALTVTVANPIATTTVGVAYTDDTET